MLDGLTEVKKSNSILDKFPFNGVEGFLKVKLQENTWDILEFCLFQHIIDKPNILAYTCISSLYKS